MARENELGAWEANTASTKAEALFKRIKRQGGRVFANQTPDGTWRVWVRFEQGEAMGESRNRDQALFDAWKKWRRGGDLEETGAEDYPDLEAALLGAQSKFDATHAIRGRNITIFSPSSRGYTKRVSFHEKGFFHWPERGEVVADLPPNAEMIHELIDSGWDPEAVPAVSHRRAAENPIDTGDGVPYVKIARDPEQYKKAMKEADAIGPIDDERKIYDLLGPALLKEDQEVFLVVLLDVRQQCRGVAEVHRGSRSRVSTSLVDIMRVVLTSGAEGFIVVHNHPSGKASPSDADKDLTKAISKAANLFDGDLTFIDHVIVGNGQYYSFYDKKLYRVSEKKRKLKRKAA